MRGIAQRVQLHQSEAGSRPRKLRRVLIGGVIGALALMQCAPVTPMASTHIWNEKQLDRTTIGVENEAGQSGSGCPPGPFYQAPPGEPWWGSIHMPHTCPWSYTISYGGHVIRLREFSGSGEILQKVGPDYEFLEAEESGVEGAGAYVWSCEATGKMHWATTVWDDQGSGWSESEAGFFRVPSCVPNHRIWEPRWKAQHAVLKRLRGEYVSRLRCKRRGFGWRCVAVYNNTFRGCTAVFRVDFYSATEFGETLRYSETKRRNRRCVYF